jgi:hypothetical protein
MSIKAEIDNVLYSVLAFEPLQDWHKCVVSVCGECMSEIRALKTIPARTQMAPWLAAAAGRDDGDSSSPSKGAKANLLPYLAKATELHPAAKGFGGLLQPPEAKPHDWKPTAKPIAEDPANGNDKFAKKLRKERKARIGSHGSELLASSSAPALLQGKRHAIAGGHGTAPVQAHLPPGVHSTHISYNEAHNNGVSFPTLVSPPIAEGNEDEDGDDSQPGAQKKRNGKGHARGRSDGSAPSTKLPQLGKKAGAQQSYGEEKESTPMPATRTKSLLPQGTVGSGPAVDARSRDAKKSNGPPPPIASASSSSSSSSSGPPPPSMLQPIGKRPPPGRNGQEDPLAFLNDVQPAPAAKGGMTAADAALLAAAGVNEDDYPEDF